MTLLFAEGCDGHISLSDRWATIESEISILTDGGKYGAGTNSLFINPTSFDRDIRANFPSNPTNPIGGTLNPFHTAFFVKITNPNLSGNVNLFMARSTSDVDDGFRVFLLTTGTLQFISHQAAVTESSGGLTIGSGTTTDLFDDAWHHVEIKFVADNSSGVAKMWIDGVLEIDFSGDTTASGTITGDGYDNISFTGEGGTDTELDDIIIWDEEGSEFAVTGQYGIHRLETLIPNAAGSSTGFTVTGAASNYLAVDEYGADYNTTYVESGTSTTKDLYNFTNLSGVPDVIAGVVVTSIATNPDAANISIKHKIKSGATEVAEADHQLSAAGVWSPITDFVHQDPNTTAAWTATNLNAAEFGMEVV